MNFADVMRRRGDAYPIPTPSPFVPGAEVAGTVAALGEGVDHLPVGAAVFGTVDVDPSGGYAEYAVASASTIITIPRGIETYADADAYGAHIQSPHFLKYKTGTLHMIRSLTLIDTDPILEGAKP